MDTTQQILERDWDNGFVKKMQNRGTMVIS